MAIDSLGFDAHRVLADQAAAITRRIRQ
jgi:hypothetical protein